MKKFFAIILMLVMVVTMFTGCNRSYGFGNQSYEKIHIDTYHYSGCLTVKNWYNGDTGIEVNTNEAGSIFVSEGIYVLLEGDKVCPFCTND